MPATLSLAMIVKDEAELLGAMLADAATYCDELVVLDTGSSDDTVSIARDAGASVFFFDWIDDFSAARNAALSYCRCEWVTYLDADDRVPPASQAAFQALKNDLPRLEGIDLIRVPYRYVFVPWDSETCVTRFDINRVLRNHVDISWSGRIHEIVPYRPGRTLRREECWVDHRSPTERTAAKPRRNLSILQAAIDEGDRSFRTQYFLAAELRSLGRLDEAAAVQRETLRTTLSDDSRYGILLNLADCLVAPEHEVERLSVLNEAVGLDPTRAAAFIQLGLYHYGRREWTLAADRFLAATACRPPTDGDGAYNELDYSWFPHDCLVVCFTELGRYEDALGEAELALVDNPQPQRLRDNIAYLGSAIARQADAPDA